MAPAQAAPRRAGGRGPGKVAASRLRGGSCSIPWSLLGARPPQHSVSSRSLGRASWWHPWTRALGNSTGSSGATRGRGGDTWVLTALPMWCRGRRAWPAGSGQIPPSTGAEFRNRCLPHVLPFFNRKKKKKSPRLVPPHLKPRPCRLVLFDRSTEARASPRSSGVGRVCADISFYRSCITRMVLSGVVACVCHRCLPGRALASAARSRLAPCGQPGCTEAGAVPVALSEPGDESLGFEWIDSVAAKAIPTN